jgi:hypothetical protein
VTWTPPAPPPKPPDDLADLHLLLVELRQLLARADDKVRAAQTALAKLEDAERDLVDGRDKVPFPPPIGGSP